MNAFHRGRRLRWTPELRTLVRETPPLLSEDLIMPYFVVETADAGLRKEIPSMPGQYQLSLQELEKQVAKAVDTGLTAVILFGIPAVKDEQASGAYAENGIVQQAVRLLKQRWPKLLVITDVCLCEYMSHGHCGVLMPDGAVLNDATLPLLAKTAVSHAEAGADMVAPSDMMDGRVAAIREALIEALADLEEGADALIVKPAGPYSDIIRTVRDHVSVPLCAYQVSGEYSLIRAAGLNGWVDERAVMLESLTGLKRAGADMIITYFTETLLKERLVR